MDKTAKNQQELAIHCGKNTDGFEELQLMCEKRANELKPQIDFSSQSEVVVSFWTDDFFSELICTGTFRKNSIGEVVYELDFSESTL